mgnify:CR=1 FL=1
MISDKKLILNELKGFRQIKSNEIKKSYYLKYITYNKKKKGIFFFWGGFFKIWK